MKVCYLFSLESPRRGDSNEYTQHTIINIKKKIILNCPNYDVCSYEMFSKGLKNEPSVLEPLNACCTRYCASRYQN